MSLSRPLLAQIRSIVPTLALALAVWAALIGFVVLVHYVFDVPFGDLTRDPADIFNTAFYMAFLSQASISLWAAAAAVSLFGSLILPSRTLVPGQRGFLFGSGLLTLFLALDDTFLIHDKILPRIGVPETVTFLAYGALVFLYFVRFRSLIFRTDYVLLGLAVAFFGVSIVLDVFQPAFVPLFIAEDAAKLAGILCWLAYFARVAWCAVSDNLAPRPAVPRS